MERISHLAGVVEMGMQPGTVTLVQVAGDGGDAGQEGIIFAQEPTRRWIPIGARSGVHAPQFIEKSH